MHRPAAVAFIAALLCMPTGATAQGRVGLGLGLQNSSILFDDDIGLVNSLTPQVYVPIAISNSIIVEPGVGFFRLKESEESDFGDEELTATALRLGLGVLFVVARPERGRIYAGPRAGIMRISSTFVFDDDENEMKRTDLVFAGVLGGEFFLMPAFSLGGEAGLTYLSMGQEEIEPDPGFEDNSDGSSLSLGTEFRVRWYLR